jgi:hypothetical protein
MARDVYVQYLLCSHIFLHSLRPVLELVSAESSGFWYTFFTVRYSYALDLVSGAILPRSCFLLRVNIVGLVFASSLLSTRDACLSQCLLIILGSKEPVVALKCFFWSTILLCCSNFPRLQHVVVICYSLYSRGLFVALRLVARLAKARFPRYCLLDGSCVGREEHYIHQGSLGESPLGRWCCNVFVKLASEPLLQSL